MDKFTDLLLVSAPLHSEGEQEGRVYVYSCVTPIFQVMSKHMSLLILSILLKIPILF